MKKYIGLLLAVVIIGEASAATDCAMAPDCKELGYINEVSECDATKGMVKCPFDEQAVFCREYRTADCLVGAILYSDGKCYNSFNSNYNVPEGVVPIGVVLDEVNRLAAALKDAPGTYTQVEAIDYCANDKTGGVTWMLPTKEELVLLFDKDNQFKKSSLYSILESSERYWSSTQKTSSQSWTVYRGTAGTRSKTYSCKSRCITSF